MWRLAVAQVTGSSHLRAGTPCQDALAWAVLPGGTLAVAVADGAGSAPRADEGAAAAVRAALAHLQGDPAGDVPAVLRAAALAAREAVLAGAEADGEEARSYASTLLLAVAGPDGGGALQIGDGVVVAGGEEGWRWVVWPQRGEYANTTYFLTDEDASDHMEVEVFAGGADLAVMTDGLEPLALHYASRSVHEPFFEGMFHPFRDGNGVAQPGEVTSLSASLAAFLASDRIRGRTDDDLSLILATRR